MRSVLPAAWIVRDQDPDYGVDLEVEIVIDERVSGLVLQLQLKASRAFPSSGGTVRLRLGVPKIKYLMHRQTPVLLVAYDKSKGRAYWLFLQRYVYQSLDRQNPDWRTQATVTVRIPEANELNEESHALLAEIAEQGPTYLFLKTLTPSDFLRWLRLVDQESVLDELRESQARLRSIQERTGLHLGAILLKTGLSQEAARKFREIYESSADVDPCIRSRAIAGLLQLYNPIDDRQNRPRATLATEGISEARKCGDLSLEAYFVASQAETIYIWLTKRVSRTLLARQFVTDSGVSFAVHFLTEALGNLDERMRDVGGLFVTALEKAYEARDGPVMATIGLMIVQVQVNLYAFLLPFLVREDLKPIAETAQEGLDRTRQLAEGLNDWELQAHALKAEGSLRYHQGDSEGALAAYARGREFAAQGKDVALLESIRHLEELTRTRPDPLAVQKDELPTPKEEEDMVRLFLDAWGVDLESDDLIAKAARDGLRDFNPGRVFRWCEHLHIVLLGQSSVGQILGLPIGQKLFWCQHGGAIVAASLDRGLKSYKRDYCEGCKYHSPRPNDWEWTRKWQMEREIPEELRRLLSRMADRG